MKAIIFYKFYTLCKIPLLPIWKYNSQQIQRIAFKKMVDNSDIIQLLSPKFIPAFLKIVPNTKIHKVIAIENPIVFDSIYPIECLNQKSKKFWLFVLSITKKGLFID